VRRGRADRAAAETRPARIEPEISAAVLNREPTILVSMICFFGLRNLLPEPVHLQIFFSKPGEPS
jgi:hypothetical protein